MARQVKGCGTALPRSAFLALSLTFFLLFTALITPPSPAQADDANPGDPLSVELLGTSPATIPRRGPLRITGEVKNTSQDEWTELRVYPVFDDDAITTAADLYTQASADIDIPTGVRYTEISAAIASLGPGERARFTLRIPQAVLREAGVIGQTNGVYWYGAQVLGANQDGRPTNAVGRARSFLSRLPVNAQTTDSAIVVPIRRDVRFTRSGAIRDLDSWADDLAPNGRLQHLLQFAEAAPTGLITWVVDPAVLDAVARISQGNPTRHIGDAPASDGAGELSNGESGQTSASAEATAEAAGVWLGKIKQLLADNTVLATPYGDVDISGALAASPKLLTEAYALSQTRLAALGIDSTPIAAPPSGQIDPINVAKLPSNVQLLLSDTALKRSVDSPEPRPSRVTINGRIANIYDSSVAAGAPTPARPLRGAAVAERFVAEAAVRSLDETTTSLIAVLPVDWDPGPSSESFFAALPNTSITYDSPIDVVSGVPRPVRNGDLRFPKRQRKLTTSPGNFETALALVDDGAKLQSILPDNTTVAAEVAGQAYTSTSYFKRHLTLTAQAEADTASRTIDDVFNQIQITAPPYLTMSSGTGRLRVDVVNGIPAQIKVRVTAITDDQLTVSGPSEITLEPGGTNNVLLEVNADGLGVHQLRLYVADTASHELGPSTSLPVRANQVGQVIWVIMGVGALLLFGAIGMRLYRRFSGRANHRASERTKERTKERGAA